jgi:hypothetical protein
MVEGKEFIELVSPLAPAPASGVAGVEARVAPAWSGFRQARVSIVENGKANALELLHGLRASLISRYGALPGITIHKEVSGPIRDDAMAELAAGSELVLVGTAD